MVLEKAQSSCTSDLEINAQCLPHVGIHTASGITGSHTLSHSTQKALEGTTRGYVKSDNFKLVNSEA